MMYQKLEVYLCKVVKYSESLIDAKIKIASKKTNINLLRYKL